MSDKKIADNKSFAKLSKEMQGMKSLLTVASFLPKFMTKNMDIPNLKVQLEEISNSSNALVSSLDKFNECFAKSGWIAYESLNTNTIQGAIQIFENDGIENAEEFLANSYDENTLKFGLMRFHGHRVLSKRIRLLELAKEDYLAERYHACIPLILSLIDGIVNDISNHVGFFAEKSDLIIDDTISGHATGLHSVRKLLSKGRNKTTEDTILIPFRNGILHGRDLAFDNKIVASKCWHTLFAIENWAKDFDENRVKIEPEPEKSLIDFLRGYKENQDLNKRISNWKPRSQDTFDYLPTDDIHILPPNSPEKTVAEFFGHWANKRWKLVRETLSHVRPEDKNIKQTKDDFIVKIPISYEIINTVDETPAISVVTVKALFNELEEHILEIRVCFQDTHTNLLLRNEKGGEWKVIQNSFSKVIYDFRDDKG